MTQTTPPTPGTQPRAVSASHIETWRVTLTPMGGWAGLPIQRLRSALKVLGRSFGLKCVSVEEIKGS